MSFINIFYAIVFVAAHPGGIIHAALAGQWTFVSRFFKAQLKKQAKVNAAGRKFAPRSKLEMRDTTSKSI